LIPVLMPVLAFRPAESLWLRETLLRCGPAAISPPIRGIAAVFCRGP